MPLAHYPLARYGNSRAQFSHVPSNDPEIHTEILPSNEIMNRIAPSLVDVNIDIQHGDPDVPVEERFTYDVCMVFEVPENQFDGLDDMSGPEVADTPPKIVERLKRAGMNVRLYQSVQGDEVYCLIGATEERLEQEAERTEYPLRLNRNRSIEIGARAGIVLAKVTKERDETSNLITTSLWDGLYGRFNQETKAVYEVYENDGKIHLNSVFWPVDRIMLLSSIIQAPIELGGSGLAMGILSKTKSARLHGLFALHDPDRLNQLEKQWMTSSSYISQPIEEIRDYFGEEIGMYFSFLQFYNRWLVILAFFGVIFFIVQAIQGMADAKGIWVYAIFSSLWGTLFLETWKRKESRLSLRWGMTNFAKTEQPRPEFIGSKTRSPIDGKLVQYFPFWQKVLRAIFSQSVVWFLIIAVTAGLVGVFVLRRVLVESSDLGKYYAAVINAVMIIVFNYVYGTVSESLNEYENHQTDTQYFNALISKNFLFKFVNSYNSLFYFAFFRQFETDDNLKCDDATICLEDLAIQLGFVFGSMIIINNSIEILTPMIKNYMNERANSQVSDEAKQCQQELKDKMTAPEKQFNLEEYLNTVNDYEELAIQFGYVVMFVIALPITPLLALANNIFEISVDSTKILKLSRRPEPRGAADIGTWKSILTIISFISIITNVGIAVFYSKEIHDYVDGDNVAKLAIAAITEHIIIGLKFAFDFFIPDEPTSVAEHRMRQDHIERTLIDGADEECHVLTNDEERQIEKMDPFFDMATIPAEMESDWHIQFQ